MSDNPKGEKPAKEEEKSDPAVVTITVSPGTEDVTVAPTSLRIKQGQEVHFHVLVQREKGTEKAPRAPFLAVFPDANALGKVEIRGGGPEPFFARGTAGPPGLYHYQVAVCVDEKVCAVMGCPEVIIRR